MSVTPQSMAAYSAMPVKNLNATISEGFQLQRPGVSSQGLMGSSRSQIGGVINATCQHESQSLQKKGSRTTIVKGSATPQSHQNLSKVPAAERSPPPFKLKQDRQNNSSLKDPVSEDRPSQKKKNELEDGVRSSILTVTVLEAKLKVDTSSFLQKMQVYCQVKLQTLGIATEGEVMPPKPEQKRLKKSPTHQQTNQPVVLDSQIRKTQCLQGTQPKWSECFVFDLQSSYEYIIELSVWSTNYLVRDSCIGRAFLKFNGSQAETGRKTNWLPLKCEFGGSARDEDGQIFVSIAKEAIVMSKTYEKGTASEEFQAVGEGDVNDQGNVEVSQRAGNQQMLRQHEESEVHSTEEDFTGQQYNAAMQQNQQRLLLDQMRPQSDSDVDQELEGEEDDQIEANEEEGTDSPVDDIALEEAEEAAHKYQQLQHQQVFDAQNLYNQGLPSSLELVPGANECDFEDQIRLINRDGMPFIPQDYDLNNTNANFSQDYNALNQKRNGGKTRNPTSAQAKAGQLQGGSGLAKYAKTYQQFNVQNGPHSLFQTSQPSTGINTIPQQQHAYLTGGFRNNQFQQQNGGGVFEQGVVLDPNQNYRQQQQFFDNQDEDSCLSDDVNNADQNGSEWADHEHSSALQDSQQHPYDDEDDEEAVDYDEEGEQSPIGIQTPNDELELNQNAQMQLMGGGNPSFLMQLQQQTEAEQLADLHHDFVEENARLRQEGINNEKIHKKLEREAKQIKHEKSNLKKWQAQLHGKSKRIKAHEEQLVYKKQQIEKESIKINKSMQKMRRIRQILEQSVQLSSQLVGSEIFARLQYEASLTQSRSRDGNDENDDWLLSMQAQNFVNNLEKVRQILEQVATDNALKGGATGSGDLNSKMNATNPATVQTTQHYQQNSQSSLQTQGVPLTQNQARSKDQSMQQLPYAKFVAGSNTIDNIITRGDSKTGHGKSQYFVSDQDDTSVLGERSQLTATDHQASGINVQRRTNLEAIDNLGRLDIQEGREDPSSQIVKQKETEAYWTNSSIREIHGQHSHTFQQLHDQANNLIANDNSTPNLTQDKEARSSLPPSKQISRHQNEHDSGGQLMKTGANSVNRNKWNALHGRSEPTEKAQTDLYQQRNYEGGETLESNHQHKSQSTILSPSKYKESYQLPVEHTQSRFHTELGDEMQAKEADLSQLNRPNSSISQPLHLQTSQMITAQEMYVRHLDVDLGDPELQLSNLQQQQQSKHEKVSRLNESMQQLLTGTSMTPEPVTLSNHLNDASHSKKADAELRQAPKPKLLYKTSKQNGYTPTPLNFQNDNDVSTISQPIMQSSAAVTEHQMHGEVSHYKESAFNASTSEVMQRQQEMYGELIGQMSRELQEIQAIKQNLAQMASQMSSQQQQSQVSQSINAQLQTIDVTSAQNQSINDESAIMNDHSVDGGVGLQALQQQQMQFLLEQQQQQRLDGLSAQGEEEDEDDCDKGVEGYIWESMQRNAHRMQQFSGSILTQQALVDSNQVLEGGNAIAQHQQQLQQQYSVESQTSINGRSQIQILDCNGNLQKISACEDQNFADNFAHSNQQQLVQPMSKGIKESYLSSSCSNSQSNQTSAMLKQSQKKTESFKVQDKYTKQNDLIEEAEVKDIAPDAYTLADEPEDDELEFKFDPDFLNKINANMAMNDQIFEQRQEQQHIQGLYARPSPQLADHEENYGVFGIESDLLHDQQYLVQQSTLQGEQAITPAIIAGHEEDQHEATSFISTEQITIVGGSNAPAVAEHQESIGHDASTSFIMEYSNNLDQNTSRVTDAIVASGRESIITGQNLQGGASYYAANQPRLPQSASGIRNTRQQVPHVPLMSSVNDTNDSDQPRFNYGSPKTQQRSFLQDQRGTVMAQPETQKVQVELTNTVQKLRCNTKKIETSSGHDSIIRTSALHEVTDVDADDKGGEGMRHQDQQQMTANDFEISNRSSVRGLMDPEDDISRMINESLEQSSWQNQSVIYKDDKVFDQPKRALYGIQPAKPSSTDNF